MSTLRLLIGPENPLQAVDQITPIASGNAGDILMLDANGLPVPVAPITVNTTSQGIINAIINGSCQVAQRAAGTLLNSTWVRGAVDRFDAYAYANTSVGAGTITQITSLSMGHTKTGLHLNGVTLTGADSSLKIRHRIEAKDAQKFMNRLVSFGCYIYHTVGVAIPVRMEISVAASVDDFSAPTLYYTSLDRNVNSETITRYTEEAVLMADCSNGIEIVLIFFTGPMTTKHVYVNDLQFESGSVANPIAIPSYGEVLRQCQRYYEIHGGAYGTAPIILGYGATSGVLGYGVNFAVSKRVAPTMAKVGTWDVTNCGQPAAQYAGLNGYEFVTTVTTLGPANTFPADATCYITADAEFAV